MVEVSEYLESKGITTVGAENEHVSSGWIGIDCPVCGETGQYHMGISIAAGGCRCWRCGKHKLTDVIKLLNINPRDFFSTVNFSGRFEAEVERPENVIWPTGISSGMWDKHREYLERRRFPEPEKLARTWNIRTIGPAGKYSWRLILPVFFGGEIVSWTSRDVTGRADTPYISAPKEWETRDVKNCLYGSELAQNFSRVIAVEGPFDAMRLGPGAVATLGSAWTLAQAQILTAWKTVYVMYDMDDEEAVENARSLAELLDMAGTDCEVVQPVGTDSGDPGGLQNNTAVELRKELGLDV